jgi:hypothetical protein
MFGGSFRLTRRRCSEKLEEYALHHSVDGFSDRRRQWRPDIESFAFDEVGYEMARQPVQAARKFDCLGNAESMGGAAREAARKRSAGEIETMDPARSTDRRRRIDDNYHGETVPLLDQGQDIAAAFEDANPGGHPPAKSSCDRRPEAIITSIRIANSGDEHTRLIAAAHIRFTRKVKKCAAHEMHGS